MSKSGIWLEIDDERLINLDKVMRIYKYEDNGIRIDYVENGNEDYEIIWFYDEACRDCYYDNISSTVCNRSDDYYVDIHT